MSSRRIMKLRRYNCQSAGTGVMAQTERVTDLFDEKDQPDLSQSAGRILRLMIQRRWLILATACVIALTTIVVLFQLPNHYSSDAIIVLVQQQVPERYV